MSHTAVAGDAVTPEKLEPASSELTRGSTNALELFVLLAVSSYVPLDTWVSNPEGPSLITAVGVTLLTFAVLATIRFALRRLRLDSLGATYAVATSAGVFLLGGPLIEKVPGGRIVVIGVAIALAAIVYRLRQLLVVRMIVVGVSIAMLSSPLIVWVTDSQGADPSLHFEHQIQVLPVSDSRDVLVVIADGYANSTVLDEFYGDTNQEFVERLRRIGFVVHDDAVANYSDTVLSVPSILEMSYLEPTEPLSDADRKELFRILGGHNSLTASLSAAGYRSVYVESGWLGTQCGDEIDVCVKAPIPDETLYDIAHRSLLRDTRGFETGLSFSRGARHALDWMRSDLPAYLTDDVTDFIYVHLLAPHPPLFLDQHCQSDPSVERSGFSIGRPDMSPTQHEVARLGYLAQVACVNSVLSEVGSMAAETDAVVVFAGDHGPDIGGQLWTGGGDNWTDAQIRERFGPFVALYGRSCQFDEISSLVQIGPSLIECLGGPDVPSIEPRAFTVRRTITGDTEVVEIDPPVYSGP